MNATPDPLKGFYLKSHSSAQGDPNILTVPVMSSPATPWNRLSRYDEEWATFVADRSRRKFRPMTNSAEPEPLPRVWNCPRIEF
jgi:hypothetical protein